LVDWEVATLISLVEWKIKRVELLIDWEIAMLELPLSIEAQGLPTLVLQYYQSAKVK